jgi:hypothetical protein
VLDFVSRFLFFVWLLVHDRQGELWVAIDNEILNVFISAFVDEYGQKLRRVGSCIDEETFCELADSRGKLSIVVLEDLALIKQLYEASDFSLSKVDNLMLLEP